MNVLWKLILTGGGRRAALAVVLAASLLVGISTGGHAAPLQVRLRGHIPAGAIAESHLVGRIAPAEKVSLALALPLRDPAGLDYLLGRLYNRRDPLYGKYLTTSEFTSRFGPTVQAYQSVIAFARARGLVVTGTTPNRLLLNVSGPAATVEAAFGVHMMRYQGRDGRMFHAPDADPLVPAALIGRLSGVIGLSDAVQARPHLHRRPSEPLPLGLSPHVFSALQPNSQGSGPTGGFTPADIKTAYNLNQTTLDGTGRSLALYELDGYLPDDILAYESYFGLPHVPLQNVLVDSATGSAGIGAGEVTLDIELMIALAPRAAKILVYEGGNQSPDIIDTYNKIANDNLAKEVSTSWGFPENLSSSAEMTAESLIFKQMAVQGQSIFAAAGDSGAYDDGGILSATSATISVDDPASQPFMVGVGGTSLSTSGLGGSYRSETTWATPADIRRSPRGAGGGGGVSVIWQIPDYQAGVSGMTSASFRNVPDVSLNADFNTGYDIYFGGGWGTYGGTSCAAPLWAAFTALVNQQRAINQEQDLGFANPAIYAIGASADYAAGFHDIADGSDNLFYKATVGYDNATGWGTFNGGNLIDLLAPPLSTVGNTLTSLVFSPSPAYGGHKGTATVSVTNPAPTGGLTISLVSEDLATLPVPATVLIPSAARSVTFSVTPAAVTASKFVSVTATTAYGSSLTSRLEVRTIPAVIVPATLTVPAPSVYGGTATTGTVTLNGPAPSAGLVVTLTGSDPAAILPTSISIPAEAVSATFPIGTQTVVKDTPVTLTAAANGTAVPATLTVIAPAVGPIVLAPSTVTGGSSSAGTLTLNGPAPAGGVTVALTSDTLVATVSPASVTIPEGGTTATFTVATQRVSAVTTATIKAAYNGASQTAALTVQAGGLSALSLSAAGVISGGSVTGTVTLDSPAALGGATIALRSALAAVTVPASVTVLQGALTATFPVTTSAVTAPVNATISGTLNGLTQTATLAVAPIRVKTLTLTPGTAPVGGAVTGTLTLTAAAPAGGLSVTLASSAAAATVPATVLVGAGLLTATFPVTPVQGGVTSVSATTGGLTVTAGLTVLNAPGTTFPAGLNFLSAPFDYSGQSLDTVFGFRGVRLAVWQPGLAQYAVTPVAPADALRPGVGYWVTLPKAVTLTQAGVPTNSSTDFRITLLPGWNQIGDPFPVVVRRSGLKISQGGTVSTFLQGATGSPLLVSSLIYGYAPGVTNYYSVGDTDALQPGLGYWVYAYQAVTLIISHTGS